MTEPLTYEARDGVALLTMDDGKANALNDTMLGALESALDRAEAAGLAVVIAGRAGRFSAGFDLKVMMSSPDAVQALVTRGSELCLRLYGFPRPVVAACTGHALAAGALVLLSCDKRIGAEGDFKLGLNEVAIGMILPQFAVSLVEDRINKRQFAESLLGAQLYAPTDAVHAGYLDEVVSSERVIERAMAEAARLAALPPHAYAGTKAKLRGQRIAEIRAYLPTDMANLGAPTTR